MYGIGTAKSTPCLNKVFKNIYGFYPTENDFERDQVQNTYEQTTDIEAQKESAQQYDDALKKCTVSCSERYYGDLTAINECIDFGKTRSWIFC